MILLGRLLAFRNAFMLRGLGVWVFARMSLGAGQVGNPHIVQEFGIMCVISLAVVLDARRRDEDLVLGNLGIGRLAIAVWALPLAMVLEMIVP